jgi:hypothetical protein
MTEAKVNYKGVNFKTQIPTPLNDETSESWVTKVHLACEIGGCISNRQKLFCKALWNGMLSTEGKEAVDLTRVSHKLRKAKQKIPTIRMIGWDGEIGFRTTAAKPGTVSSWLPSLKFHIVLAAAAVALLITQIFRSK